MSQRQEYRGYKWPLPEFRQTRSLITQVNDYQVDNYLKQSTEIAENRSLVSGLRNFIYYIINYVYICTYFVNVAFIVLPSEWKCFELN